MIQRNKILIGWWEYLELPELTPHKIKAKIDTGAKTSALHAENIEMFREHRVDKVRFTLYPHQKNRKNRRTLVARMIDEKVVKSSVGITTRRPVIVTPMQIGILTYEIELTLINRDLLGFRMLLGRQAMKGKLMIDPSKKNVLKRSKKK